MQKMCVIDPWEEHCIECGEPECYKVCPKFQRSAVGKCARFERGIEWRREGAEFAKVVSFKEWGKLELLWHGGMSSQFIGKVFDFLDRCMPPLMCRIRLFRWWRSLRWRLGKYVADAKKRPTLWEISCTSQNDCSLIASIVNVGGNEVFRSVIDLKGGVKTDCSFRIPEIKEGALIRLMSIKGSNGEVVFHKLILTSADKEMQRKNGIKVVAWDLDGTLWDGILVEDGVESIKVKDEVVAIIKELNRRGVVSSIVSKNDSETALAALKSKGLEELFVFPQISWGAKTLAISHLAKEINVGLNAIAFVDDSDHERREVKSELPNVKVYERLSMEDIANWGAVDGCGDDRRIAYREEMVRRGVIQKEFDGDAAAFLAASNLQVETLEVKDEVKVRALELIQRTNQLNLTGRRYAIKEFDALLSSADCIGIRAYDKYGDYGIVGFIAHRGKHIVECCFSCRTAGKGVERRVLEKIADGGKLTADIVATERNGAIRKIIEEFL
jgi:FkbH-like protein